MVGLILLVLAGCLLIYASGRSHEAGKWRPKLEAVRSDLTRCQENRRALERELADLSAQNAAFAAQMQGRVDDAEKESVRARSAQQAAEAEARKLLSAPSTGDQCADVLTAYQALREALN